MSYVSMNDPIPIGRYRKYDKRVILKPDADPTMKTCTICFVRKSIESFSLNHKSPDGHITRCKPCAQMKAKQKLDMPGVRDRYNASDRERRSKASPEDRERENRRHNLAGYSLGYKYSMTVADYERMLNDQGGHCALCPKEPTPKRRLAVDHDHSCCSGKFTCGKCIRGLLCTRCNTILNVAEDSHWLDKANAYLENNLSTQKKEAA